MALTDNLVSAWELDEASGTRADQVGAQTLTDNNTVTSAAGIGGSGTAALFTAANSESLSHVDSATLSMGDIDWTMEAWVYFATKASVQSLIAKWGGNHEYLIYYNNGTDRLNVLSAGGSTAANTLGAISTATWYCIHAWHDATAHTNNIAVNAGSADTDSDGGTPVDSTEPFELGCNGGSNFFNGRMARVRVWKRVLTSLERTTLYNGGTGLTYAEVVAGGPTSGVTLSPPAGAITMAGLAPAALVVMTRIPTVGAVTLTGLAPSVNIGVGDTLVAVPAGAVSITGQAPSITNTLVISVPVGAITLTGTNVQVAFTGPDVGLITLAGLAPAVVVTVFGNPVIAVPAGVIALAGQASTVSSPSGHRGARGRGRDRAR